MSEPSRYAMIMAGGAGTRLWPMSRAGAPKQLLPFIRRPGDASARSLLELAAMRLEGLVPHERRLICTAESYRGAVRAALPEFGDAQILGEPVGRDTVNAVGLTAAVLAKGDPEAVFAVLTADHIIEPVGDFQRLIGLGFRLVEQDRSRLVTFSIKPTHAATGFGYVERGASLPPPPGTPPGDRGLAFRVQRFVEKPDLPRAQAYVESGHFGWNSGMFVLGAATVLDCLRRFKPECYGGLMAIQAAWGTPDQARSQRFIRRSEDQRRLRDHGAGLDGSPGLGRHGAQPDVAGCGVVARVRADPGAGRGRPNRRRSDPGRGGVIRKSGGVERARAHHRAAGCTDMTRRAHGRRDAGDAGLPGGTAEGAALVGAAGASCGPGACAACPMSRASPCPRT